MSGEPNATHRVRLVVERFDELKGLRLAWVGIVWALIFGGSLLSGIVDRLPPDWALTVLIATTLPLIGCGLAVFDRYYDHQFGRVCPKKDASARDILRIAIISVTTVVAGHWSYGVAPLICLAGGSWLWIAIRDWPHRAHYSLGTLGALSVTAGIVLADSPAAPDVEAKTGAAVGLMLIALGWLDHRLLSLCLPGHSMERERQVME